MPHKGSFTLSAAKEGYTAKTVTITDPNGVPKTQDFTLSLLSFKLPEVRRSKMLISTNGDAVQSFTNILLNNGTPVTSGAAYSITEKPAGLTDQITVDSRTGEVRFGKPALDKVNADGPQTVTIQAAHQGSKVSFTFTLTDHFSPRMSHSSVVLEGEIYVIGGTVQLSPPYIDVNEVWRSSDGGLTWDQAAAEGKRFTPGRSAHNSIVLGNDIYVIAGQNFVDNTRYHNDVWKSADRGVSWVQTADSSSRFPHRAYASAQVLKGVISLMGGDSGGYLRLNDVWTSADGGRTWRDATQSSTSRFDSRSQHSSVVLGEGDAAELYVIGGQGSGGSTFFNDVWKSRDGETWSEVTVDTAFSPSRSGHTSALLKEGSHAGLYLIAGQGAASNLKDVWKSTDQGKNWTRVTASAPFGGRTGHTSVVRGTTMYVIGGSNHDGTTLYNDVWKSGDGGTTWENVHKNP